MDVSEISVFASYIIQVLMNLMMISMMLLLLARGKACGDRVVEVLNTNVDIIDGEKNYIPDKSAAKGKVEFKNVNFKYNSSDSGDDILHGISFTAEPGQVIGVVGGTGCGKSSLVNLIPRLYDVTDGQVLIDGVDVRDYNIRALRDMIALFYRKTCCSAVL